MATMVTTPRTLFDDPRTLELKEVIRPFLKESGVGIAVYPSKELEDTYEYSLIGFDSIMQKIRFVIGRQTEQIQLQHIHSLKDVILAMTNLKRHAGFESFELSVFAENTDETFVEFFKDEPLSKKDNKRIDFRFDPRTKELLNAMKSIRGGTACGIMVFPEDENQEHYLFNIFDIVQTEDGRRIQVREGMKNVPLKAIQSFDDIVLAMSNAKAYDGFTHFDLYYGTEKKYDLPAMMFYKA